MLVDNQNKMDYVQWCLRLSRQNALDGISTHVKSIFNLFVFSLEPTNQQQSHEKVEDMWYFDKADQSIF